MARQLASRIGYRYIDSGAMYRAVTLYAIEHGMITDAGVADVAAIEKELPGLAIDFAVQPDGSQHTLLCGRDVETEIRQLYVSNHVSTIDRYPCRAPWPW